MFPCVHSLGHVLFYDKRKIYSVACQTHPALVKCHLFCQMYYKLWFNGLKDPGVSLLSGLGQRFLMETLLPWHAPIDKESPDAASFSYRFVIYALHR